MITNLLEPDNMMMINLNLQSDELNFSKGTVERVFSQSNDKQVLKGNYIFINHLIKKKQKST